MDGNGNGNGNGNGDSGTQPLGRSRQQRVRDLIGEPSTAIANRPQPLARLGLGHSGDLVSSISAPS
ncbi:hypothetical protein ABZP36_021003 [Zizania latifolia]